MVNPPTPPTPPTSSPSLHRANRSGSKRMLKRKRAVMPQEKGFMLAATTMAECCEDGICSGDGGGCCENSDIECDSKMRASILSTVAGVMVSFHRCRRDTHDGANVFLSLYWRERFLGHASDRSHARTYMCVMCDDDVCDAGVYVRLSAGKSFD